MINILIIGTSITHAGIPEDTETELIYSDIIYPKNILGSYFFLEVDLPEDIYLPDYEYIDGIVQLKEIPNGDPS